MDKEVIIEIWDGLTQVYLGDEVIYQFDYEPEVTPTEVILSALGYSVNIIDRRTPEDYEDADEAFYAERQTEE